MGDQNLINLVGIWHGKAVDTVVRNLDPTESINHLITINCPLYMKYKVLNIVTLIKENGSNIGELKKISQALNILEKYARHLLKPPENRSNMWRFVKFSNQIFKERVDAIKGGRQIMRQMGYVQDIEDGLAFPDGVDTDEAKLSSLVTDIILGKRELDTYFNSAHPHPQYIDELVHQNTIMDIKKLNAYLKSLPPEVLANATKIAVPHTVTPPQQQSVTMGNQGIQPVQREQGPVQISGQQMHNYQQYQQGTAVPDQSHIIQQGVAGQRLSMDQRSQMMQPFIVQSDSSSGTILDQRSGDITSSNYPVQQTTSLSSSNQGIPMDNNAPETQTKKDDAFESIVCDICGDSTARIVCEICDNKQLCTACDTKWHKHPKRQNHKRKNLLEKSSETAAIPTTSSAGSKESDMDDRYVTAQTDLLPAHIAGMKIDDLEDRGHSQGHQAFSGQPQPHVPRSVPLSMPLPQQQQIFTPVMSGAPRLPGDAERQHYSMAGASNTSTVHTLPPMQHSHGEPQSRNHPKTAPGGPPVSRSSTSKFLPKIMAVTDLQKRKSKAEVIMETIQEEIDEIEEKIQKLIEENPMFYEDDEYVTLYRKKGMLQREKIDVNKYMKELESMITGSVETKPEPRRETGSSLSGQQIFYPPPVLPYSSGIDNSLINVQFQQPHTYGPVSFQPPQGNIYPNYVYVQQPGGDHVLMPAPPGPTSGQSYMPISSMQSIPPLEFQGQGQFQSSQPYQQQQQPYNPEIYSQIRHPGLQVQPQQQQGQGQDMYQKFQGQGQQINPVKPSQSQMKDKRPLSQGHIDINIPQKDVENRRKTVHESNLPEDQKTAINQNATNEFRQGGYIDNLNAPSFPTLYSEKSASSEPKIASNKTTNDQKRDSRNSSGGYNRSWICEHCTYHNGPDTRVCEVCYKTSTNPQFITDDQPASAAMATAPPEKPPERERTRSSSEETQVMEMASYAGKRIAELQDEIYWEKQEAKKRFAEQMEKEKQQAQQKRKSYTEEKMQTKVPEEIKKTTKPVAVPVAPMPVSSPYTSPSSKPKAETVEGSPSTHRVKPNFNFTETMEQIQLKREKERFIIDGKDLINLIKNADKNGFDVEEVQIALLSSSQDRVSPMTWLTENWQNTVDYVVTMVTNEGSKMNQNEIGELSYQEAKNALKEHTGNVQSAIQHCIQKRTKLFKEITEICSYPREEILQAMLRSHGDFNGTMDELNSVYLQTFLDRVWLGDNSNQQSEQGGTRGENSQGAEERALAIPRHDSCVSVTNSVLTHTDFQQLVKSKDIDLQRRIRMILVEGKLQSWGRAATVIKILDHEVAEQTLEAELEDIVEAVRNCGDRQSSLIYLQQDCDCCFCKFPMSKIRSLGNCECKICYECMKGYFEVTIRERHVRNLSCPLCSQPDMEDIEAASEYLGFLTMLLQTMVSQEILDLYQTKLRDWHLQKDPNFRWCSHCGNGFIWGIGRERLGMQCPTCRKKTCFLCKKQWEDQHEGLTCEEYNQWKIDNDPENQAAGLAKHLELNGIDCPSCKMSYSLAKGGCMHFTCPQCGHEFCSGCSQPFDSKGMCTKFKSCRGKGLHCHHPRDCFYYLRDNDIAELQKLLQDNRIQCDKKIPDNQEDKKHCPVMEQKEYAEGKQDEACGKDIEEGHAGLCLLHYKEYLVGLIRQHKIDPVAIMKIDDMINLLQREEKHVTKRKEQETDPQYRKRLKQSIKEKIPVKR